MPLDRRYTLFYGPKPTTENGVRSRNKVLMPCGCWTAEVWRTITVPDRVTAVDPTTGKPTPRITKKWCQDTVLCGIHSAKAAVVSFQLGEKINGPAFRNGLGDGAKRLLADATRVLAEAAALDQELATLSSHVAVRRLPKKKTDK